MSGDWMNLSQIISGSFKYPFNDFKNLILVCILFILPAIFPLGILMNQYVVKIIGLITFFIFILILPGYLVSVIKMGTIVSSEIPALSLKNIVNTFKLLVLRIVYMIIPAIVSIVLLFVLGFSSIGFISDFNLGGILLSIPLVLGICLIVWIIFKLLLIIAKARLAYYDSLKEALKINKVIRDIKNIGLGRTIGWAIILVVLFGIFSFALMLILISIHYAAILIYAFVFLPIYFLINYYSLGLLYSNVTEERNDPDYFDFDEFEKEIQKLKYGL